MTEDHELWSEWVINLKELGLNELMAGLVKAGEPLSIIICQLAYIIAPMIYNKGRTGSFKVFVDLLEDKDQRMAFTKALLTSEHNT